MSENEKIMKILAVMFLMRFNYWHEQYHTTNGYAKENALGRMGAFDDAYDMLAYAAEGNLACLSQFGWYEEAKELIERIGPDTKMWELEDIVKGW